MVLSKERIERELKTAKDSIKTMKDNIEVLKKGIEVSEIVETAFIDTLETFK